MNFVIRWPKHDNIFGMESNEPTDTPIEYGKYGKWKNKNGFWKLSLFIAYWYRYFH